VPVANGDVAPYTNGTTGCAFIGNLQNVDNDVSVIPAQDWFGDNTIGYYTPVTAALTGTKSQNATSINMAALNVADQAARHIRNGDAIAKVTPGGPAAAIGKSLAGVIIFSIGLANTVTGAPPNADFLRRVANTSDSSSYDSTKPEGFYIAVTTVDDLDDAFSKVAGEVLRLAK
jgi:hypothetical protein